MVHLQHHHEFHDTYVARAVFRPNARPAMADPFSRRLVCSHTTRRRSWAATEPWCSYLEFRRKNQSRNLTMREDDEPDMDDVTCPCFPCVSGNMSGRRDNRLRYPLGSVPTGSSRKTLPISSPNAYHGYSQRERVLQAFFTKSFIMLLVGP